MNAILKSVVEKVVVGVLVTLIVAIPLGKVIEWLLRPFHRLTIAQYEIVLVSKDADKNPAAHEYNIEPQPLNTDDKVNYFFITIPENNAKLEQVWFSITRLDCNTKPKPCPNRFAVLETVADGGNTIKVNYLYRGDSADMTRMHLHLFYAYHE